ncbi:MAG: AbrB/MazE/SpoVT family DNA-binding domain-containing protein [Nitrospirota bacterium]
MKAVVAERGQVTIPKRLRERLGIKPGTVMEFTEADGKLVATKASAADPIDRVYGCLESSKSTNKLIEELRGPA